MKKIFNNKKYRKRIKGTFLLSIISTLLFFTFSACSSLGKAPRGQHKMKLKHSSNYNKTKKMFVNRRQKEMDDNQKKQNMWKLTYDFMFKGAKEGSPKKKLPILSPDMKAFMKAEKNIKFIWFGHSTFLVNIQGTLILFDPVFSTYGSPVPLVNKRFQKTPLSLKELPPIDYIVISHDHYDHLDKESVLFFKDKKTIFVTPLGVTSYLTGWGIDKTKTHELDWWESIELGGITFVCTPSQHFSGRSGVTKNPTLWASWVVKNSTNSLFYSGDSGYDIHFKEIGDRLGPFDLAFMENGQYNQRWKDVHMLPEETIQAFEDVKAKQLVPVHWGGFNLSLHNWYDPIESTYKNAKKRNIDLIAPKIGEIISTPHYKEVDPWWKPLISSPKNQSLSVNP